MKTLTLFLSLLFSFPFVLSAQMVGETLQKVSAALDNRQWDQAITLFRQAVNTNVEKAEMFYWTGVDKSLEVSSRMGRELAAYYKKSRSYDKAYLFYKELLQKSPNDVNCLVSCAEMEVCRGRESEALETYRKVLSLDADNLAANIFIGNYLYLKAEREKKQLEADYKKISAPTRMQYARYRDGLSRVMSTGYGKAREYLQKVISQFPSTEAQKTLERIKLIEKEVTDNCSPLFLYVVTGLCVWVNQSVLRQRNAFVFALVWDRVSADCMSGRDGYGNVGRW